MEIVTFIWNNIIAPACVGWCMGSIIGYLLFGPNPTRR